MLIIKYTCISQNMLPLNFVIALIDRVLYVKVVVLFLKRKPIMWFYK